MAKKSPELSEAELRRMLLERREQDRRRRLAAFEADGSLLPSQVESAEDTSIDPLTGNRIHEDPVLELDAPPRPKSWADRLLLLVELAAVAGLLFVLFSGLSALGDLNAEVAAIFEEPAQVASPTPIISAVVLPSGHTPPTTAGGAQPNEAEIPEHLRPQVQTYQASLVIPTPGPEQAIGIKIQALDISAPVVQGDGWEELKRGVGQHIGSANPGENGNMVLSGHNDVYGEVFRHLDKLEVGDEVIVFTANNSYTYLVTNTLIVEPTAVYLLDPTEDATLTLISCYPYLIDSDRIVVQADLVSN